eukprot:2886936-Amphidinium_carterae.1
MPRPATGLHGAASNHTSTQSYHVACEAPSKANAPATKPCKHFRLALLNLTRHVCFQRQPPPPEVGLLSPMDFLKQSLACKPSGECSNRRLPSKLLGWVRAFAFTRGAAASADQLTPNECMWPQGQDDHILLCMHALLSARIGSNPNNHAMPCRKTLNWLLVWSLLAHAKAQLTPLHCNDYRTM